MQRNYTPQGKPQGPGALDAKLKADAVEQLKALHTSLAQQHAQMGLLVDSVVLALNNAPRLTSGYLSGLVRNTRTALGLKQP